MTVPAEVVASERVAELDARIVAPGPATSASGAVVRSEAAIKG